MAEPATNNPAPTPPAAKEASSNGPRRERRGPPPNPLYHPLFLPILLVLFSLWFAWDGFFTTDPDMLKHRGFNRGMFAITALLCLRVVPRGLREHREEQAAAAARQAAGKPG